MKKQDSRSRSSSQALRSQRTETRRQRDARESHEFLAGLKDPDLIEYFELSRESSTLANKVWGLREEQTRLATAAIEATIAAALAEAPADLAPAALDALLADAPDPLPTDGWRMDKAGVDAGLLADPPAEAPAEIFVEETEYQVDREKDLVDLGIFPTAPMFREDRAEPLDRAEDLARLEEEITAAIEASRDARALAVEKYADREASTAVREEAEEAEAAEFGLGDGRDEATRRAETAYARQARAQQEEKTQPLLERLRKAAAQAEGEARTRAEALALRLAHRAPTPKQRREAIALLVRLRQPGRRTAARAQLEAIRAAEARLRKAAPHQKAEAAHQKALVLARTNWREIDRELCHELREMDPADREKAAPRLQAHLAKRYDQVKAEKAVAWAKAEKAFA